MSPPARRGDPPLAATVARLRALAPDFPDTWAVELPPDDPAGGPGWCVLAAAPVERWLADARSGGGPASLAAAGVGGALAQAVLARVTAALALDGRAWDVAAGNLLVHRAPAGHLDRVRLRRPVAWVLPGDAAAGGPSVRVLPDRAALLDAVAAAAVATLAPLFARIRVATRFGLVPLWNAAGDAVRLAAAHAPLPAGRPPRPDLAAALLDAMVARGAPIRGRGRDLPLAGRPQAVPVRAACCLMFRLPGLGLCTTCPILPADEAARRYAAFLDAAAARRDQDSGPVR